MTGELETATLTMQQPLNDAARVLRCALHEGGGSSHISVCAGIESLSTGSDVTRHHEEEIFK